MTPNGLPGLDAARGVAVGRVVGGSILRPGSEAVAPGVLEIENGHIAPTGTDAGRGVDVDASDAWVLPGIVDVHGDAFERSLMPRGGVMVDVGLALADNAQQLLASGITTSLLSATDSWEPGLRSRATLRELVAAVSGWRRAPRLAVHVRHERCNTDDLDELIGWVRAGAVRMVSFNDHTPGGIARVGGISPEQVERSGVGYEELTALLDAAVDRRPIGFGQEADLARACVTASCPTASHDASAASDLERDRMLGVGIAEFPMSIELARQYRIAGIPVLLGAPNLVRGGSHLGNLSVADAWRADAADMLCSDYHYPSLLQAPFVLWREGLADFATAWSAVSSRPATAVGFDGLGDLRPGNVADVVVVEPPGPRQPMARVRAVVVDGCLVHGAP